MVDFIVKDNIKEMTRWLNSVQRKQIPFATSRALNDTAIDGQKSIIAAIPRIFKSRKKWWLKQQPTGIKVKFSNKRDLTATVHTSAYFAEIQEKGGIKTPKRGRNLAIPTNDVPKKYRTSHGAKDMMREKNNVFSTPKGVFKRTGKKKLTLLWSLAPTAKIKARFGFVKILEKVVKRRFKKHFETRLRQAMATAKPPSRPR
tara:strand:+ start:129 stop:731 length:603 start_codon:yes stop_codon:yes gene_type:complete